MAHQVLKYHPPNRADGWPAQTLTDEDLALLAHERGVQVDALVAEALTYLGAGGKPLYTLTAKGEADGLKVAAPQAAPEATPTEAPPRG